MSRNLTVVPYVAELEAEWEDFLGRTVNGTFFHSRRFHSYHPAGRFDDASVLIRDGHKLVSVVPAAWSDDDQYGRVFNSHPGASYGGPVFSRKATGGLILDAVEALEEHAHAAGAAAIKMRLAPQVFHTVPLHELEFALTFRGFALWRRELSSYVTLQEDLVGLFQTSSRNQLRQAMKSELVAGESDDFEQFWSVLAENLRDKHASSPTHSLEEILLLRELAPDTVRLFVASLGDKIAAGVVAFVCNAEVVHTFYMASREELRGLRPLNLALFGLMQWARENRILRINFGISTEGSAVLNRGLLKFKEGIGGRGVCRDTFVKRLTS